MCINIKRRGSGNSSRIYEALSSIKIDPSRSNLSVPALIENMAREGEGILSNNGCVSVLSGENTGRAAEDKFIVDEPEVREKVWWSSNKSMSIDKFERLCCDVTDHLKNQDLYSQNLIAGSSKDYQMNVTFIGEYAWHALFMRHMLIPTNGSDIESDIAIISSPSFQANPDLHGTRSGVCIAVSLERRIVIITGTKYAGETKKAVFTLLNYILPEMDVLPMHCSANHELGNTENSAIFFGLSGTGKTTLSTSSNRVLIGDDEHGWSKSGVFNFEGGCYAKAINLSSEQEPEIYETTEKFGTILENVFVNPVTRKADFSDSRFTENTRISYPLSYISSCSATSQGGTPKHMVILTCDAFGVMPPVARLTPAQAVYHFLSGFTSKVSGTEQGIKEPTPTFSACFGAPFIPRNPIEYGKMLKKRIQECDCKCWLINTGWINGGYGVGSRIPISVTRNILDQILSDALNSASYRKDPFFKFEIPIEIKGVEPEILDPINTWDDQEKYLNEVQKLLKMFHENFKNYIDDIDQEADLDIISSALQPDNKG